MDDPDFPNRIARLCHDYFESSISKNAKPQHGKEWTVISAFVKEENSKLEILALGTGTKCLGESETSPSGDLVHDCHAEVLAKRALVLELADQIEKKIKGQESVFEIANQKFQLKKTVLIHFYSSLPPCGDASIAPKMEESTYNHQTICDEPIEKKPKLQDDIHRTGAKSIEGLDLHAEGSGYHVVGIMRTKPGRGSPTQSLSCSDKMLKWNLVGLQGTILTPLLQCPIRWTSITIGGHTFNQSAIQRAIFLRAGSSCPIVPIFHSAEAVFSFSQQKDVELISCDKSFAHNTSGIDDVIVDGRKQSITNKFLGTEKSRVKVCRYEMAKKLLKLLNKCDDLSTITLPSSIVTLLQIDNVKYSDFKNAVFELSIESKTVYESFVPKLEERKMRRKKLDSFLIGESSNKNVQQKQTVILLKGNVEGSKDKDFFAVELQKSGFETKTVPVSKTEFINQEILQNHLEDFLKNKSLMGILVRDVNSAKSLVVCFKSLKYSEEELKTLPVFVQNESIGKYLSKKIMIDLKILDDDDDLMKLDSTDQRFSNKKLLILQGDDLQIAEKSTNHFCIGCHKSIPRRSEEVTHHLNSILKNAKKENFDVVFFQQSAIECSSDFFLTKMTKKNRFVAINEEISEAMSSAGLKAYEMTSTKCYLDFNATTPLDDRVIAVIEKTCKEAWANPSSNYERGKIAREVVQKARGQIGDLIGAENACEEITFTSGGTEANHLAMYSAISEYRKWAASTKFVDGVTVTPHIITTTVEHCATELPLRQWLQQGIIEVDFVPVNAGQVKVEDLISKVKRNTCLITCIMANNETGVIQPVSEISNEIESVNIQRKSENLFQVLVHTDAAQTIGKIEVKQQDLKVDYITIVGHKFYGPRIGALYHRHSTAPIHPLFFGGGQEKTYRPGTENTPMIAGLGEAAFLVEQNVTSDQQSLREKRDFFEKQIKETFGDKVSVNFVEKNRLPNTSNVAFQKISGNEVLTKCSGFLEASVGAACHSGLEYSSILVRSGLDPERARCSVRFSLGRKTTKEEIDLVINSMKQVLFK